jgi:hypothetical protein
MAMVRRTAVRKRPQVDAIGKLIFTLLNLEYALGAMFAVEMLEFEFTVLAGVP